MAESDAVGRVVGVVGVRVARGGYRLAKGWLRGGSGWNERLVSTLAHFVGPATRWKAGRHRRAILTFSPLPSKILRSSHPLSPQGRGHERPLK